MSRILRLRPLVPGLALLLLTLGMTAAPVRAFDVGTHALMTNAAIGQSPALAGCSGGITQGAVWPDAYGCIVCYYCPEWLHQCTLAQQQAAAADNGPNHFDNNEISTGVARAEQRLSDFQGLASLGLVTGVPAPALLYPFIYPRIMGLGQAFHAVQDFYAHSTYAELQKPLIKLLGAGGVPLWDAVDLLGTSTLSDGTVISGLQTGWAYGAAPGGGASHDQLNKDSGSSPEGAVHVFSPFGQDRGSYNQIVSGKGSIPGIFDFANGLAPRHSLVIASAAVFGGTIFVNSIPEKPVGGQGVKAPFSAKNMQDFLDWAATDPTLLSMENYASGLVMDWLDGNDIEKFPFDKFDANGYPLLPTPVQLSNLVAEISATGVRITWAVDDDRTVTGIRVERSREVDGPWVLVSQERMPASTREFVDTDAPEGVWFYRVVAYERFNGTKIGPIRVVVPAGLVGTLSLALTSGNPARGPVSFSITNRTSSQRPGEVTVYDAQGREVRQLLSGLLVPGPQTLRWDGHDGAGRAMPPGIYFVMLRSGAAVHGERVCLIR